MNENLLPEKLCLHLICTRSLVSTRITVSRETITQDEDQYRYINYNYLQSFMLWKLSKTVISPFEWSPVLIIIALFERFLIRRTNVCLDACMERVKVRGTSGGSCAAERVEVGF